MSNVYHWNIGSLYPKCSKYSLGIIKIESNQSPGKAFLSSSRWRQKKCIVSAQLYRQFAYTEWQKEMPFLGLSMGIFLIQKNFITILLREPTCIWYELHFWFWVMLSLTLICSYNQFLTSWCLVKLISQISLDKSILFSSKWLRIYT